MKRIVRKSGAYMYDAYTELLFVPRFSSIFLSCLSACQIDYSAEEILLELHLYVLNIELINSRPIPVCPHILQFLVRTAQSYKR